MGFKLIVEIFDGSWLMFFLLWVSGFKCPTTERALVMLGEVVSTKKSNCS